MMPTYGFLCLDCNKEFEKNVPLTQRGDPQNCPTCQGTDTKRLYHPFAFRIPSEQEVKGKKAGLNTERWRAVKEAREKKAKEGESAAWNSDMSKLSGISDKNKIDPIAKQYKVEGNNTINLRG